MADISVERRVRPTRAEIDLDAIVSNARQVAARAGVPLFGVIKADAYGHGAVPVGKALVEAGVVRALAVSLAEEGLELRSAGVPGPILVMGGVYGGAHRELLAADLTPVVSEPSDVEAFALAASSLGRKAELHLKIDTGMSRLGARPEALPALADACQRHPEVAVTGICTHLASADVAGAAGEAQTREQLARFAAARAVLRARGIDPPLAHAANSAGALRFPDARLDAVRPGLALYGGGQFGVELHQAMRLVSSIGQLRTVQAGDSVSYGALWTAPAPTRVATLPVGYADGYPRRLTGKGEVLVRGRRCSVLGAVCMDMTLVDVTRVPEATVGDEVVLLGGQEGDRLPARELAERAGLIEYEITCGISKRVPRVYSRGCRES